MKFALAALALFAHASLAQAACVLDIHPINVKSCGATGNGATDDTAAIQAALDLSQANGNKPIYLPTGKYRTYAPLRARQGTMILGEGSQGSTASYGTTLAISHTGDGIVWDGTGANNAGTGGGARNLLIIKENVKINGELIETSGGTGIRIQATSDLNRPGEMVLENILVYGATTARWDRAYVINGRAANTSGARGVRSISMSKVRAASCAVAYECIVIDQGTHITGTHVQVDTGNGVDPAGLTIRGISTNVNLANIIVHGTVVVEEGSTAVNLHGRISELMVRGTSVSGTAVIMADKITNASKIFRVLSNMSPSFRAKMTATLAASTGGGALVRPVFNVIDYNYAQGYDSSTGIFTAPVAGRYRFSVRIGLGAISSAHTRYDLAIQHRVAATGQNRFSTVLGNPKALATPTTPMATLNSDVTLDLGQGDQVSVSFKVSGGLNGMQFLGATDNDYTYFSGSLE